jgi:two-component system catabolic regulation response regulator CreB/two-component system response regulator ChvI
MNHQQEENSIIPSKNGIISSKKKKEDRFIIAKESRILLVDDEMNIVKLYKHGLRRGGFEVEAFNDPEMALSHFEPDAYDLAILDIRMPKMSGFELCREIRKRDEKIRICFMTAFEMHLTEFEKVLPSIKVDGLVTKPIHMVDLCSTIQRLLNNSRDKT